MNTHKFYHIETKKSSAFNVPLNFFKEHGPLPILWNCAGLFRIIPLERVANMYESLKDYENLSPIARTKHVSTFYWESGTDIDSKTAKIMLSFD